MADQQNISNILAALGEFNFALSRCLLTLTIKPRNDQAEHPIKHHSSTTQAQATRHHMRRRILLLDLHRTLYHSLLAQGVWTLAPSNLLVLALLVLPMQSPKLADLPQRGVYLTMPIVVRTRTIQFEEQLADTYTQLKFHHELMSLGVE
jgi:hypothetical protein